MRSYTIANLTEALVIHKGDFDSLTEISAEAKSDLQWWINNLDTAFKPIEQRNPDIIITSDASNIGWGGVRENKRSGGQWSESEVNLHINQLELLAAWFTLQTFCAHE